ncbi:MAG: hypothetical protein ACLRQF_15580 [Thomasclavelia ramosa]
MGVIVCFRNGYFTMIMGNAFCFCYYDWYWLSFCTAQGGNPAVIGA